MWLPNEAYETIEDMYVWRGRTRKKQGYKFLGRLHLTPTLPEALINVASGVSTYADVLANFPVSPGTVTITITVGVALWPAVMTFVDNGNGTLTCTDAAIAGGFTLAYGIINYETGAFDLYIDPVLPAGGPFAVAATAYRYLPRLSVMGLGTYEQAAINQELLIAFDEDYSYLYNVGTNVFDVLLDNSVANPATVWNGTNSNFFWTTNYWRENNVNKLFWATNNVANVSPAPPMIQNGIQIYNGNFWYAQTPQVTAAPVAYLRGCLMLIPYRDRMVALNTLEGAAIPAGAVRFSNRARWSQNGVPFTNTLVGADANAWRSDQVGVGGFLDAPTSEAIVSAAFNKDTLIVFFERSTWQLRYVYNEAPMPFVWEHINSELGAESTFSPVIFDEGVFAVGDKGIVAANSISVYRIDEKIPDLVFNIHNDNNGRIRVHGARDFYNKMVYWCYPDDNENGIFPNKVLALNYDEKTYSIFNDTFTCFGTWQSFEDQTWDTLEAKTWDDWTNTWGSPKSQSFFPNVIAGNQKGFVEILNQTATNAPYADLTNITNANPAVVTLANHNLYTGQFVKIDTTRGFEEVTTLDNRGTAELGAIWFTGTLADIGMWPASAPVAGGPPYISVVVGANQYTDIGNGTLRGIAGAGVGDGTIDYITGTFTVNFAALGAATAVFASYSYNILNSIVFYVSVINDNTFELYSIDEATDATVGLNLSGYGAAYAGWGEVTQVSNFKLRTKRFNPFLEQGEALRMLYLDLLLQRGSMTFKTKILADNDSSTPIRTFDVSCDVEDDSGLGKEKLWKRVYANAVSDFIQLEFELSNYQMTQSENYSSDLRIHTMILEVDSAGRNINRS